MTSKTLLIPALITLSVAFFSASNAEASCGNGTNKPSYESTQNWKNRTQECVDVNGEYKLVNGELFRMDGLKLEGTPVTFVKQSATFNRENTSCTRKSTGKTEVISTLKTYMLELTVWGECDNVNVTFGCSDAKSNFEIQDCAN
jgi:hypothetical protein